MRHKNKKAGLILLTVFFACLFLYGGVNLLRYYMEGFKSRKEFESLSAVVEAADSASGKEALPDTAGDGDGPREILPRYRELYAQNPDLAGWLRVDGTGIDYPVMFKGMDYIDYYLHRDFSGDYSYRGCLYIKEDCDLNRPSDVIVVYGHNMKDGTMFGPLKKFENAGFAKDHPYFEMDTLYETRRYEIISVFRTQTGTGSAEDFDYWRFVDAEDEDHFNAYVQELKRRSLFEIPAEAVYGDKLVELSTCEYSSQNERLVVAGKQIQ